MTGNRRRPESTVMQGATCVVSCCCLVICLARPAEAETIVSGTIAASTWTESGSPYHVTGDLTVRGTTREKTFQAAIALEGDTLVSTAHIELTRWEFGLYDPSVDEPEGDGVGDDVLIDYEVRLVRD